MLPQLFARRYLFSSQSRSVVNLISGLSVAAVAMPVAAMIILLSVFNGFESLVKSMYSAFDADLTVSPRQGQTFAQRDLDTAALARIPGVGALSFTLEQSALLEHGGRQATATIRGVDDAYGAVFQLGDAVSAGEWRVRLGDLERLVVGQSMAWMLGIRSLADADVTLYAVRRGSFSSLLPLENYTRRTEPVGGVYTLDLETERTYVLASLRLAQELFGYPGRASALVVRLAPGADAAAEEAPAPRPKKRVKTAPRIYNETVEDGSAPAGEDAFGPVVRVGGAVPAAHGKKAEKAVKAETQEAEKDVWAHPAKEEVTEQTTFAEDLTIEPDEYELPDDEAPFDVPPAGKKPLPRFKKGAPAPETEDEEAYAYPPIDLLAHGQAPDRHESDQSDMEKAQLLGDTLRSFGIETRLTGIAHGPAVTRFELQPAPGVKVSRITSLSDDIALNLAAERVRIEAPIPGKAAVGVEVPNDKVETVALRDVLESSEARRHPSRLAVGLGKDNSGRYIVADIAKMPHVLIAGQTGSGKSVCINAIIVSILYRATPDEVKLILIDPKVVELSVYNGIPHLIAPVVTDPKKAASALDWAVAEMTQRYKRFAERGVRDIKGYNKALEDGEKPMPQIVIIIDELADLMMVAPGEVEDSICRLAQLARAAGMHLVIATQRPSVNVITGIIKANIPTRIAFSVSSQVDSRTMIDHGGAEKLLGNGDMLFVPSGINKPMRVQGAWVSDQEVHAITEYIKQRHETTYDEDVVEKINQSVMSDAEKEEAAEEYDPRLPEAVEIVIEAGQASISMLQRRMRVGYARAGRLIDDMAQRGIVSEADGAKPRTVLITREQYQQMFEEGEEQ